MTTRSKKETTTKTEYMVDCGQFPSDPQCTLKFLGANRNEVMDAAVQHAVAKHGHTDSPELRASVEKSVETIQA